MSTQTSNYNFEKPTVGGESDAWGGLLNANWDAIDALLSGTGTITGATLASVTLSGTSNTVNANAGTLTGVTVTNAASVSANAITANNQITETIQAAAGLTPAFDPSSGGTIATWTLTASGSHAPTFALESGEFITLVITGAASATITWPAMTWFNGEPTLDPAGVNLVEIMRIGATTYGIYAGAT